MITDELPTVAFQTARPRWSICVAIGAVIAFVLITILAIVQVARGAVAIDAATGAILLLLAGAGVVSWSVVLLRDAWRRR